MTKILDDGSSHAIGAVAALAAAGLWLQRGSRSTHEADVKIEHTKARGTVAKGLTSVEPSGSVQA